MPAKDKLTGREQKDVDRQNAHGKLVSILVGVSEYNTCGFSRLPTCTNDAEALAKCLKSVHQLNADKDRSYLLTSSTSTKPSKGEILALTKKIVALSEESDRLLFYFSGHGYKLDRDDRAYLVPSDVWDLSREALIGLDQVTDILNNSPAREKYIVLDACFSGPTTNQFKGPLSSQSVQVVTEYIENTSGVTIIGSCAGDQRSHTRSPDASLSLFTYYFDKALNGEPAALRGTQLTSTSLVEYLTVEVQKRSKSYHAVQTPAFKIASTGIQVWADFATVLEPGAFKLNECPIRRIDFIDESRMSVDDVLTEIKRWTYGQEYLEGRVNDMLGDHLRQNLGELAAKLSEVIGGSASKVSVEGPSITFPGGCYEAVYIATSLKQGLLRETVSFKPEWFDHSDQILNILGALSVNPDRISFQLTVDIDPQSAIPGLKAGGWELVSSLGEEIQMKAKNFRLTLTVDCLQLEGFTLKDLFGPRYDTASARLAIGIFRKLPKN